ncbi:MAG: LL-diaminopimelate aminotransferase [Saprospiraceae bacterium]|jgi:LL-diaminopimelate aminotransferase
MKIETANRVRQIEEYYFSKKLKEIAAMVAQGIDVLNLGIGSPDLSPAKEVINRLSLESQKDGHHKYQSYIGVEKLRNAFAIWYQHYFHIRLDPQSEILPLMGSKEGIMHISMTFLQEGDEVLIPNPGYPAYRATALLAGATPVEYLLYEKSGWLPDLKEIEKKDLSKVKIMWINYPHMPTGANANVEFFKALIAFAKRHNILIVNDNPYSFILNQPLSILSVEGAREVAIELNSLSKSHNMAGWRMGMMAGKSEWLAEILKFKSNMDSGMFLPAQLAAVQALSLDKNWYADLNRIYTARKKKVLQIMDLLDCTCQSDTGGMFVWGKISGRFKDAYELSDIVLNNAHVFLTPGGVFGSQGDQYIRISLCAKLEVFEEAYIRVSKVLNTIEA